MSPRSQLLHQLSQKVSSGATIAIGFARYVSGALKFHSHDDLTFVYHTARLDGVAQVAGLLPLADCNAEILQLCTDRSLRSHHRFIAGICATDPFRVMDKLLRDIKDAGFVGVQNFPTLGMMDGNFRARLEESQIGFRQEVEMIRLAHSLDLLTVSLVFDGEQATQMAEAGSDVIVIHPGPKAFRKDLDIAGFSKVATRIATQARKERRDALVLRYNGPSELVKA